MSEKSCYVVCTSSLLLSLCIVCVCVLVFLVDGRGGRGLVIGVSVADCQSDALVNHPRVYENPQMLNQEVEKLPIINIMVAPVHFDFY